MATLVRLEYVGRIVHLRVEQARSRSGLNDLLDPALCDLDEMTMSVRAAKDEVTHALGQLVGK